MQLYWEFMHSGTSAPGSGAARASEDRRDALRRIIRDGAVGRQAELVRLLKRAGYPVTQSSVSRDLRDLGVAKLGDRYVLAEDAATPVAGLAAVAAFVQDAVPAGPHLTVVRTTIGSAQSVALAIDRARWPEVVGTISGDDTIFIATASERAQRALLDRLRSLASR
jgi:transcriptional regulator of arginine metabolism